MPKLTFEFKVPAPESFTLGVCASETQRVGDYSIRLEVYPAGLHEPGYVAAWVQVAPLVDCSLSWSLDLVCTLRLIGSNLSEVDEGQHRFTDAAPSWGWDRFAEVQDDLLGSGLLDAEKELHLQMSVKGNFNARPPQEEVVADFQRWLAEPLQKMWSEKKHTDMFILAEGAQLPCHRVVLASASPAFDHMIHVQKKVPAKIKLTEVTANNARACLRYLYTGRLPDDLMLEEGLKPLLSLAAAYTLPCLAMACADRMLSTVEDDTICATLQCLNAHKLAGPGMDERIERLFGKLKEDEKLMRSICLQGLLPPLEPPAASSKRRVSSVSECDVPQSAKKSRKSKSTITAEAAAAAG